MSRGDVPSKAAHQQLVVPSVAAPAKSGQVHWPRVVIGWRSVLLSGHLSRLPWALARALSRTGEYGGRAQRRVVAVQRRRQHQHRLRPSEVDALAAAYQSDQSLAGLVETFGIHRTTVLAHLKRRGLHRPPALTDAQVVEAGTLYRGSLSLTVIAERFGVSLDTVARYLAKAGIRARPSRGPRHP